MISAMLNENPMIEGTSGQVEIPDFSSDTIENLLFFMYNSFVDKQKINSELLKAANKYLMDGLKNICCEYLSGNLTLKNALDVMVAAYLADQKELLDAAFKFAWDNKGSIHI